MKFLPLLALTGLALISCTQAEAPKTAAEAKTESAPAKPIDVDPLLATSIIESEKPVLIDVRTPGEFTSGTIKGAKNIDFHSKSFEADLAKLDKSKTYLVYCRSGNRSGQSLPVFEKLRFAKIYHLDGGINAWKEAGHPVE